ncbi:MAG: VanZ family protein [Clostridia bacterium]|nr:VanZ family protein [Clostridia bacterium]
MKRRLPFIVATVIATLFIFSNSMQTAEISSQNSGGIADRILWIFGLLGQAPDRELVILIVRKTAHIAEFTLHGILLANCFEMPYNRRIIYILFFGLLTACIDEYIQLFSYGRAGMIQDVFIDFIGTIVGTAVAGVSYKFRRK